VDRPNPAGQEAQIIPRFLKLTLLFLLFTLTAACARPTAAPGPSATNPPPPTATVKPAPPSLTETSVPLPTVQTGCTDRALYVKDLTIPDNTSLRPGEAFTKTWQLKNTGTCIWNGRYALIFVGGERMGAVITTPLTETPPGATLDISVNLTAPSTDGAYTALFELRNPRGTSIYIGSVTSIWVKIRVGNAPAATAAPAVSAACSPQTDEAVAGQILALLNAARAGAKQPALTLNTQLGAAAQGHSADMACQRFFSHDGSNGSSVLARVTDAGYTPSFVGEIIFAGGTAQEAVTAWLNHPPHREVLLDPHAVELGVGYASLPGSPYGSYFTVDFGAP
jgi:uncharacterized protein YkwD